MAKKSQHRFFRDELGAVAATYALALVPLIAVTGLAFDYARLAGMDTELQNAADQAALAGATQLDRQSGSMDRAIAAIQGGLIENSTLFSNVGSDSTVSITEATQIVFYSSKADAEAGVNFFTSDDTEKTDADARFVQVTVDTREARYALTPIVGALYGELNASALAGLGSSLCRIPPLMICNPYESNSPVSEEPFDFDAAKGKGLLAKKGGGGKWTPGNYGYLDIGTNGAPGIREALGWNSPGDECISLDGVDPEEPDTVDTETGNVASGPQAINTRFDIYSTQGCINNGTCSPAYNSRKDLMRLESPEPTSGNSCDIHKDGWVESPNAYHPTSVAPVSDTTVIDSMGHPRDICHAVEESNPDPANCHKDYIGDGVWDRNAYFRTYYGWTASEWPTKLLGITMESSDNIANISRYDVYKWEEQNDTRLADKFAAAPNSTLTTRNKPVCGAVQLPTGYSTAVHPFDRRRMTVAVINCKLHEDELNGKSPNVPVVTWADIFLVQPSYARGQGGKFSQKDEIYAEIIGETDITRVGAPVGPTIRRDMPYLVK